MGKVSVDIALYLIYISFAVDVLVDPPHPRVVSGGILGGKKSPGNVMNCPEKQYRQFNPHPTGGGGGYGWVEVLGSKLRKFGKSHELPRKCIYFVTPHPPGRGGEGREGEGREGRGGGGRNPGEAG